MKGKNWWENRLDREKPKKAPQAAQSGRLLKTTRRRRTSSTKGRGHSQSESLKNKGTRPFMRWFLLVCIDKSPRKWRESDVKRWISRLDNLIIVGQALPFLRSRGRRNQSDNRSGTKSCHRGYVYCFSKTKIAWMSRGGLTEEKPWPRT